MKFLALYRMVFFTVISVTLSVASVIAAEKTSDKPRKRQLEASILTIFQDSVAKKKPESKSREKVEKPPQNVQDDRIKEVERRAIKQVPRSVPKLKPQPVTERIQIRRPPMKVPKKGYGGHTY